MLKAERVESIIRSVSVCSVFLEICLFQSLCSESFFLVLQFLSLCQSELGDQIGIENLCNGEAHIYAMMKFSLALMAFSSPDKKKIQPTAKVLNIIRKITDDDCKPIRWRPCFQSMS